MSRLDGIIRFRKWELDEKRKALGELNAKLNDCEMRISLLDAEVEAEKLTAAQNPIATTMLGAFMAGADHRYAALQAEKQGILQAIDLQQEVVATAFKELKSFEIAGTREDAREKQARDKAVQDQLDAAGLRKFL